MLQDVTDYPDKFTCQSMDSNKSITFENQSDISVNKRLK